MTTQNTVINFEDQLARCPESMKETFIRLSVRTGKITAKEAKEKYGVEC